MTGAGRLFLLFGVLLAIRVVVALLIDGAFDVAKEGDLYPIAARSIADGLGFTAEGQAILWRAPLFPYFLAGIFELFGDTNYTAVLIAHAVLDAMTGMIMWWLGRRLFGNTVGVTAAVLFMLHPFSAYYTIRLMAEPLFTLFFTATIAALVVACSNSPLRPKPFLLVGALTAVTALIKPVVVAFTPFIAVLLLAWHYRRPRAALPSAIAVVAAFVIVLAPWTARNFSLTGEFVPVATAGGYTLWLGNNQATGGREYHELAEDPVPLARYSEEEFEILATVYGDAEITEVTMFNGYPIWTPANIGPVEDAAFMKAAIAGALENPIGAIELVAKKFVRFWYSIYMPENQWAQGYIIAIQVMFLSVVAAGIVLAFRTGLGLAVAPMLAAIAYLNLMHSATFATLRYSMPLTPILILFGSFAVVALATRLAGRFGLAVPRSRLTPPSAEPLHQADRP